MKLKSKCKSELWEIFDPIKQYFRMHSGKDNILYLLIPTLIGVLSFVIGTLLEMHSEVYLIDFAEDTLNAFITVVALFISFSMAYMSILISSSSENVNELKKRESKKYCSQNGKPYNLYQILTTEITYTVITEIFFLIICIFERYLLACVPYLCIKIMCAFNVVCFLHIIILMIMVMKNMYFSFWDNK